MTTARLLHAATPQNRAYCFNLVRSNDNENYIANLLHPQKATRWAHIALRAFNVELANIRTTVSNEDLARLRFSYFRAALHSALSESPPLPQIPVFDLLQEAFHEHPAVPWANLAMLLDAREADLTYPTIRTLPDLESHAKPVHATLLSLHAALLSETPPSTALSETAGAAVGLTVLLRAAPMHAANRLSYVPTAVCERAGVSVQEVLTGGREGARAFKVVAKRAEALLESAWGLLEAEGQALRPAFWPLVMGDIYLKRLRRARFDPFDKGLQTRFRAFYPLLLQMRLLKCRLFGR